MSTGYSCPKCGCQDQLSRKYAAFFVAVDSEGEDVAPEGFHTHRDETDLTNEFMCRACDYEWTE